MLRIIQELLEHVDTLAFKVGVKGASHLIQCLFSFPLVLVRQHLVLLSVEAEKLFLIMV